MFFDISFRYIFRKLQTSFFIIAPIITIMVWITMSAKYVGLIISDNISIMMFFKLIVTTLPRIAGTILPICTLISTIVVLHNMQQDKELIVLMTSGKSAFHVFTPVLVFSAIIAALIIYIQTTLSPNYYKKFEDIQENIRSQISLSIIKPGTFNVLGSSVIYISGRAKTELENIFVSYISKRNKSNINIITAKKGAYVRESGKYFIVLSHGCKQELSKDNLIISVLKFSSFSYEITPFFKRHYSRSKNPNEKTQNELLEFAKQTKNLEMRRNCIAEYHSRLTIPFIPILNALIIAIFMIVPKERSKGNLDAFKSFLSGMINQISVITLINISTKDSRFIVINYIIILGTIFSLIVALRKRKTQ